MILALYLKVWIYRQLCKFGHWLYHLRHSHAQPPTYTLKIDSTISSQSLSNAIGLSIWEPPTSSSPSDPGSAPAGRKARPCVVSLHGGGFTIGEATDDSAWSTMIAKQTGSVVIGVDYRLAPEHPFPTPLEDVLDSLVHVYENAEKYNIDRVNIFLSGFSAGGNLALSASVCLVDPALRKRYRQVPDGLTIKGLVLFYPSLDYTVPRKTKRKSNVRPDLCLPEHLTTMFDKAYLPLGTDRADVRLSPAKASNEVLTKLPRFHCCYCEYDMLCQETEILKDRVHHLGRKSENGGRKEDTFRLVKGVRHAFDHPPYRSSSPQVKQEYAAAMQFIRDCLLG